MEEKIKQVLQNEVAPMLAFHGGAVEFVDFDQESGTVRVRLIGACHGCGMAELTLKEGIESMLKSKFPEVKSVENVGN